MEWFAMEPNEVRDISFNYTRSAQRTCKSIDTYHCILNLGYAQPSQIPSVFYLFFFFFLRRTYLLFDVFYNNLRQFRIIFIFMSKKEEEEGETVCIVKVFAFNTNLMKI